jgi:ABC-type Fe3+/spermidine/putrescine transport system ATPase subunit
VALARALVIEPNVLLLDEPLANLDRQLRDQLRADMRTLQRETAVTAILVTHDQEEALSISDQIGVMHAGSILQTGSPAEVYAGPVTPFVARFLGDANLFAGKRVGRDAALVMVRPEQCILNPEPTPGRFVWPGRITNTAFLGKDWVADVECDNGETLRVRTRTGIAVGERVTVGIAEDGLWTIPEAAP